MKKGYVYFMLAGSAVKVGYATNVERRRAQIQTGQPYLVSVLVALPGGSQREERLWHEALRPLRLQGEWFLDCKALRYVVERLKSGARPETLNGMRDLISFLGEPPPSGTKRIPRAAVSAECAGIAARAETLIAQGNLSENGLRFANIYLRRARKGKLSIDLPPIDTLELLP